MNHIEFASAIKAKYPQYADMSDEDLTRAMMAKFPEYSDIDTSGIRPQQAPLEQVQEQGSPGSFQAIAPSFAGAKRAGQNYGGRTWGAAKDLASLPLRTVAGFGAGIGDILGSGSIESAGDAFMRTMQDPAGSAQDAYGSTPEVQKKILNPVVYGSMAQDPLSLPMMALGGPSLTPIKSGALAGLMSYSRNVADRGAQGAGIGDALGGETDAQILGDLLPLGLGAGLSAALRVPYAASALKEGAKDLIRSQIKPTRKGGGTMAEGLREGLDAGYLPTIAGRFTASTPEMAKRFARAFEPVQQSFRPTLQALDESGAMISTDNAMRGAQSHLADYIAKGGVIPAESQGRNALEWLRQRISQSDNPTDVSKVLSGWIEPQQRGPVTPTSTQQAVGTSPSVQRGPVVATTERQAISGPKEVAAPLVDESGIMYEMGRDGKLQVMYDANLMPRRAPIEKRMVTIPGQAIDAVTGTRRLAPDATIGAQKYIDATTGYKELLPPISPSKSDVLIRPSTAHFRKSGILKEAFKNPETATANAEVSMGGGMDLRRQLIEGGATPTPESAIAGRMYEALLNRSAPLYGMEPAMALAATRANRYPLSLYSALRAPIQMIQEMPATARWMYDAGRLSDALAPYARQTSRFAPVSPLLSSQQGGSQ